MLRLVLFVLHLDVPLFLDQAPQALLLALPETARIVVLLGLEIALLVFVKAVEKQTFVVTLFVFELDDSLTIGNGADELPCIDEVVVLHGPFNHFSVDPLASVSVFIFAILEYALSVGFSLTKGSNIHGCFGKEGAFAVGDYTVLFFKEGALVDESWFDNDYLIVSKFSEVEAFAVDFPFVFLLLLAELVLEEEVIVELLYCSQQLWIHAQLNH